MTPTLEREVLPVLVAAERFVESKLAKCRRAYDKAAAKGCGAHEELEVALLRAEYVRDELRKARAAVAELAEAADAYYRGYCQDEAAEDGPVWTGCSEDQHASAMRLRDAISMVKGGAT